MILPDPGPVPRTPPKPGRTAPQLAAEVAWAVAKNGALTTRRLIHTYGPKPLWQDLIERGLLHEVHTLYGPVIGLTDQGRLRAAELNRKREAEAFTNIYVPYVSGAGSLADRAYLMDAVQHLERLGYQWDHYTYKRTGQVGRAASKGIKHTDQIIRTTMQIPERQMREVLIHYRPLTQPTGNPGYRPEKLGCPALYATVAHGGLSAARVRRLLKMHKSHLDIWHAPLLLAVPDAAPLLPLVRSVNTKYRLQMEQFIRDRLVSPRQINLRVCLLVLPLPHTTAAG